MVDMNSIITYLQSDQSLIFPTETVYGLGCDARSDRAVQGLLALTSRPQEKGITTLCSSKEMIEQYAVLRFESEKKVIKKYMPGPITMILESKGVLSTLVHQSNNTIGIRMPDHTMALEIIRDYGGGLATKSANITGAIPPTSVDMIDPYFVEQGIKILDGGESSLRIASTIVRFHSEDEFEILRQGSITEEEIREVISY